MIMSTNTRSAQQLQVVHQHCHAEEPCTTLTSHHIILLLIHVSKIWDALDATLIMGAVGVGVGSGNVGGQMHPNWWSLSV